MKCLAWLLPLVLASCTFTFPDGAPKTAPNSETALRAQADAWDAAIVRKDRAAVAANMAESFQQIGSDGRVADKQAFLEAILSDKLAISPYTVEEFRVRWYGDTALVSGRTAMHGTWEGKAFRSHYRFTDTYVREAGGRWRVVNVQTTEVAE
jgi:ketosteroid isomerase-like protein